MNKFRIFLCILMVLILCLCNNSIAQEQVRVNLNGTFLEFDVPPIIHNFRTMAPMRFILEALGASVEWDEANWTATATKGGRILETTVGSRLININGTTVRMDVPTMILDGRTLVPIRFISEAFDCEVDWDENRQIVYIYSNDGETGNQGIFPQHGIIIQDGDIWLNDPNDIYFKSGKANSALPPGGK